MPKTNILRKSFKYADWNVSYIIIALNITVFLLIKMMPNLFNYLCLNVITVTKFKMFWQFFTYMFVHDPNGISHLLFNMLGIFFFGVSVEKIIGSKEFILLYVTSGIISGLASFVIFYFTGAWYNVLLGASGAEYALLLSFAVLRPRDKIYLWGILPIPAPILVACYGAIELASQILSFKGGVAHITHLSGFVYAWLYFLIRFGVNPWKVWKNSYN